MFESRQCYDTISLMKWKESLTYSAFFCHKSYTCSFFKKLNNTEVNDTDSTHFARLGYNKRHISPILALITWTPYGVSFLPVFPSFGQEPWGCSGRNIRSAASKQGSVTSEELTSSLADFLMPLPLGIAVKAVVCCPC